ncbi:hypothetical protein HD806DRAFT_103446 [Xylariaceae sp. AK1471]|nr:hypothetical protein HD806DRAFT_103446 [Xylariaceae sp. AK1471]
MPAANVLSEKDANNSLKNQVGAGAYKPDVKTKADVKSMEYHRQVLKSRMEEEKYGHTTTKSTTATVGASSGSGPGSTTGAAAAAAIPAQNKKMINKTLAGPAADPVASGASSANQQYISPSDNIMSPCTAKLTALKGRQAGKAKPKSLFAQASTKKFDGENVLGARSTPQASSPIANNNRPLGD